MHCAAEYSDVASCRALYSNLRSKVKTGTVSILGAYSRTYLRAAATLLPRRCSDNSKVANKWGVVSIQINTAYMN